MKKNKLEIFGGVVQMEREWSDWFVSEPLALISNCLIGAAKPTSSFLKVGQQHRQNTSLRVEQLTNFLKLFFRPKTLSQRYYTIFVKK